MENRRKGFLVPLILLFSHLMGLIRVLLISYVYGASRSADLISYTFSFPNQARKKIEEGTGNLALIRELGEERRSGSVSLFILLFHLISLLLAFPISHIISSFIFHFTAFSHIEIEKGKNLFLSFLIFLILFSYAGNLNAYLQIRGKKEISTFLTALPSLSAIVMLCLLNERVGIYTLSFGLLIGALIYLIISFIYALKCGMKISFSFKFDRPFMKSYMTSFSLVLLSVLEIIPLFLSSATIEKGSIYFSNAYSIIILPYAFLIELFTIMVYPDLSKTEKRELKRKRAEALYTVSFLSLSISLLIASFSNEIAVFLFEKGRYTHSDALNTASLIHISSLAIYFLSLFSFIERMMFLNLEEKKSIIANTIKIALAYFMMMFLKSSIYKSSIILLLSSVSAFLFSLFMERDLKANIKSILYSNISSIPLLILFLIKENYDFSNCFSEKIPLLLVSLATGCAFFIISAIIFLLIKKRLQIGA